jgi:hypothetical protein
VSKNPQSALKATIDKMVQDSIRRILPEVMNEVLLKALTQQNVVQEQRRPQPQRQQPQRQQPQAQPNMRRQQQLAGVDRSMSLREALQSDDAGADYYEQAEQAIQSRQPQRQAPRQQPQRQQVVEQYDENEMYGDEEVFDFNDAPPAPRPQVREQVAQRISQLPPALQGLAEDSFRLVADDEYESEDGTWGDNEFAPSLNEGVQATAPNLNLDRAAQIAGVDFNRAKQLMQVTSTKHDKDPEDVIAENQWKRQQLERKRAELDRQKIG